MPDGPRSVAHPTELDRALGYEANYAGTSYITMDKIGKRIASEHCTFIGDRTSPRALGTTGYDDEGVKATQLHHYRQGNFPQLSDHAGAGAPGGRHRNRTAAARPIPGPRFRSSACRMYGFKPGPRETTLDSLIAGIDDGVLIDGREITPSISSATTSSSAATHFGRSRTARRAT